MLFNSFRFLAFLPVVLAGYWWVFRGRTARLAFLLLASYVFYMSWNPKLISLLILSTLIDYFAVVAMGKTDNPRVRRGLLGLSLVFNLGMLALFKYTNFFLQDAIGPALHVLGWSGRLPHYDIILPLGISFYTFETLSYVIDCYYRKTEPFSSLLDYAFFISFFPHLIAGPIIRPRQFLPQIQKLRDLVDGDVTIGFGYFLLGLIKKAVVADRLSVYVDALFAAPAGHGRWELWAAVLAYAAQIYCDFSGYTDMAIGVARLFGFRLPVNFRTPYLSRNVAEFWRRWHISLSSWLRDYLYIPLRGLADGEKSVYTALFATMFLGGLWHGANWTFVAWGAYHGLLLMAHRLVNRWRFWKPAAELAPSVAREIVSRAFVFLLVCVGWTLFRAPTIATAASMLGRMLLLSPSGPSAAVPPHVLALIALVFVYDAIAYAGESRGADFEGRIAALPAPLRTAVFAAGLFVLITFIPTASRPFIYFQF
ncbi:MAG: MBOAT family protein [Elusimicrobia bacterium]|nr:MBOAT family protein [Elusimicrobiota bacterium]